MFPKIKLLSNQIKLLTTSTWCKRIVLSLVGTLSLISLFKILPNFFERIIYELKGPQNWDSFMYIAISNMMDSGQKLYIDVFDQKSPVIFWLVGLSKKLGFGIGLMPAFQFLALLLVFFFGALIFWKKLNYILSKTNCVKFLVFLPFNFLAVYYLAEVAGEFQVESFGAVGVLFWLYFALDLNKKKQIIRMILAGLGITLAVAFKEPFILVIFSLALLVSINKPKNLIFNFAIPSFIASLLLSFWYLINGALVNYVTIYLPFMLSAKTVDSGRNIGNILKDEIEFFEHLDFFSPVFYFFVISLPIIYLISNLSFIKGFGSNLKSNLIKFGMVIASIIFTLIAVGLGGEYYFHHFGFAVPLVVFLVVLIITANKVYSLRVVLMSILLCSSLVTFNFLDTEATFNRKISFVEEGQSDAKFIDQVISMCDLKTWGYWGNNLKSVYAYTSTPPTGPYPVQLTNLQNNQQGKNYLNKTIENHSNLDLIWVESNLSEVVEDDTYKKNLQTNFVHLSLPTKCNQIPIFTNNIPRFNLFINKKYFDSKFTQDYFGSLKIAQEAQAKDKNIKIAYSPSNNKWSIYDSPDSAKISPEDKKQADESLAKELTKLDLTKEQFQRLSEVEQTKIIDRLNESENEPPEDNTTIEKEILVESPHYNNTPRALKEDDTEPDRINRNSTYYKIRNGVYYYKK